jgi:GNAT superfamily N-acetyltransferase
MMEHSDDFRLRLARPADADDLAKLRLALRAASGIRAEVDNEFLDRCRLWMAEHLQSKGWRCWVIERGPKLVGMLWLQLIEKIPNPSTESEFYAYITSFFVIESQRGKGLGSRLLSSAVTWCKETGVHSIILWPTEKSRPLYERFGFAVRLDLLELIIADAQHSSRPLNSPDAPFGEK